MKQHILIIAVLFATSIGFAQSSFIEKSQVGIFMGINNSQIKHTVNDNKEAFSINDVSTQSDFGFSMGILYQYNINQWLAIRPQSVLSFEGGALDYDFVNDDDDISIDVRLLAVQFPVHLVLTKPSDNLQPSLVLGGRYSIGIAEKTATVQPFNSNDFGWDVGIGCAKQFEKFTARAELVYSRGTDLTQNVAASVYEAVLDDLHKEMFSLRFYFYN